MIKIQQLRPHSYLSFLVAVFITFAHLDLSFAVCQNIRTWQANANTTVWTTTTNWNPTNPPNANNETAYIVADWQIPQYPNTNMVLSCLEIASGSMTAPNSANTLTIADDYFRNLNAGSLIVAGGSTFQVIMAGTSAQTFENVDLIPRLNINNPNTVTLTQPFTIRNDFAIAGGSGNVVIGGNLITQQTTAITIPSSATVTLNPGVQWVIGGNLTVNGVLRLLPGASLRFSNTRVLSIGATGTLVLAGSSGNAAIIDAADTSSTFTFNVAGQIDANYFSVSRMSAAGVNITGQVLDFANGSFNYIPNGGYGFTLGTGSTSLTTQMNNLGFYGQSSLTPRNVNATNFTGSPITFNNWQGVGDTANETDPANKLMWGTEAPTQLLLTDASPAGAPPATIAAGAGYTHFSTFAFSLSKTDTATDITSVKFTIDGNYNTSDITGVNVYRDNNNNCVYNAGTDTLVGTYNPSGNPASFTTTFATGNVQPSSTTPRCVHVFISTTANAQVNNTIGIKILSTDDIINSQAYPLSDTNSPPLSTGLALITGGTLYKWNGGNGNAMGTAGNWTPATVPNNTRDCEIGAGYAAPRMAGAFACRNMNWLSSGTIDWNNTANIFSVTGALTVGSTFSYTATGTNAVLNFSGTTTQSINMNGNVFPGSVTVNNGTGPVTFESSGTINGNLTLNAGTTRIVDGATLTVLGNIVVANGATFDIEPGGTLLLGNADILTVNAGGILELVGNTNKTADIRAVNNASAYTIVVNGTIRARYYSIRNLGGANGMTIAATATIDGTNYLQNGSFTYPGANNVRMLRLLRQIPGNNLDTMTFDAAGSAATGVRSVSTSAGAGTLTMTNYSGSITGPATSENVNYLVSWVSLTNTLDLTQEAVAPASSNQGAVVNLGRFGFEQTAAGAFANTDITFMRLTLIGTGSATDIDSISLYYDPVCTGTGGTLIGTTTFTGNPARAEFSGITGATVEAHATLPPKRCFYAMASISATATNGATVGIKIDQSSHVTNSQTYAFNGAASPPVDVGTTSIVGSSTYWTGATSTAWNVAGNWNGGIPTLNLNCFINAAANNPVITTAAVCKSVNIGSGTLTINNPGQLEVYGSFENSGTFNQNSRPLILRDNGTVATSQTLTSATTLDSLTFNKTAGGSVTVGSSTLNINSTVSMPVGSNFTLNIPSNKTVSINGGFTLTAGTLSIAGAGTLQIANGQTFTLNGGTLATTGTNDAYPQSLSNKAYLTRRGGAGTWNFTATSGTMNLVGFVFEWLDTAGLNIGGTTNVTQINGGQLRSLPNSAGMRALQINTTGALPSTISNFGWYWGSGNSVPAEASSYFLGFSSGCAGRTVNFDQWFGDFWPYLTSNPDLHISETACNIVIDRANSPVSLTEFKATAYNGKVVLEWTTGLEWYHKGFNVYRSISPATGFTQINAELIRNDLFTTNIHGSYAFIDEDATNGVTYYYKLEDISNVGERTLHGPVTATPSGAFSAPPPPLASTIVSSNPSGSQSAGGNGSSSPTPGLVNLEPNVDLLSRTETAMRLKITIPSLSQSADVDHPAYQHLSIPLYAKTVEAGKPELLTRTLMLKVSNTDTNATYTIVSEQSVNSTVLVAPAPAWVAVGQQLQPQWSLDASAYAASSVVPGSPISLSPIIKNDGNSYLPITIHPVAYTANTSALKKFDEIIVDVFLNGSTTWQPTTPITASDVWGSPGALRIGLTHDGIYQITYNELLDAGVLAPFHLADVSKLKLYILHQEHPLDVSSVSGYFSSGDSLRFYARATQTVESSSSYALLVYDYAAMSPGLRMGQVDVSTPSGLNNTQGGTRARVRLEQNNVAIFNEPYDQDMDLFVWGLFYKEVGGATVSLETDAELPYLLNTRPVVIQVLAKTRTTSIVNYESNLEILVNDQPVPNGNMSFPGGEAQIVSFTIPGMYFAPGKNKITVRPTGAHLIAGEYDMVYIDYIDIYYLQDWFADQNKLFIENTQAGSDFYIDGFTESPDFIYDVSQFGVVDRWTNAQVQLNGTYSVGFNSSASAPSGRRIWVSSESQMAMPASMQLVFGSSLANTHNEADVVYIGSWELLEAAQALSAHRQSQGFKTKMVELESIYNEFGKGIVSSDAIRDFLIYASENWAKAPKYVVLLGDGTYDPKGYQNPVLPNSVPVKLMKGLAFNYGSDHWFVSKDGDDTPFAVIGRIPARTGAELRAYVQKVLNYDAGTVRPSQAHFTLLSDKAHYTGENFDAFSSDLKSNISTWSAGGSIQMLSRTQMGDGQFKMGIQQSFDNASVIHYMGHGAENMWADSFIFNNNDIDALTNTKLPVVVAMNCLNANFYDPSSESFAEKLVMKPTGGAIVFWGSTSMTPPTVQSVYQNAFYEQLLKTQSSVGDAVKISKQQAFAQTPYQEALLSWTIIGDPMVNAVLPAQSSASPAPAPAPSNGSSRGCSAFGGFTSGAQQPPIDLALAFFLEVLLSLALIRFSYYIVRKSQ